MENSINEPLCCVCDSPIFWIYYHSFFLFLEIYFVNKQICKSSAWSHHPHSFAVVEHRFGGVVWQTMFALNSISMRFFPIEFNWFSISDYSNKHTRIQFFFYFFFLWCLSSVSFLFTLYDFVHRKRMTIINYIFIIFFFFFVVCVHNRNCSNKTTIVERIEKNSVH